MPARTGSEPGRLRAPPSFALTAGRWHHRRPSMSTIDKKTFNKNLSGGVDLNKAELKTNLEGTGVSVDDLKQADLDGDGWLKGPAELDAAFRKADGFDRNGSSSSFKN